MILPPLVCDALAAHLSEHVTNCSECKQRIGHIFDAYPLLSVMCNKEDILNYLKGLNGENDSKVDSARAGSPAD
jgi:hypothetical protein